VYSVRRSQVRRNQRKSAAFFRDVRPIAYEQSSLTGKSIRRFSCFSRSSALEISVCTHLLFMLWSERIMRQPCRRRRMVISLLRHFGSGQEGKEATSVPSLNVGCGLFGRKPHTIPVVPYERSTPETSCGGRTIPGVADPWPVAFAASCGVAWAQSRAQRLWVLIIGGRSSRPQLPGKREHVLEAVGGP